MPYKDREKMLEHSREYYQKHKERIREYYKKNKERLKEYWKLYYQKNKEKLLNHAREHRRVHALHTTNKIFRNINKRPYPKDGNCEICGKYQLKGLAYHHWNDNYPELGMWLCFFCHQIVEGVEKKSLKTILKLLKTYLILKRKINKSWK